MDRLFRRFELNLADLATLRNLPELRSQVDRLQARRIAALHASRRRTGRPRAQALRQRDAQGDARRQRLQSATCSRIRSKSTRAPRARPSTARCSRPRPTPNSRERVAFELAEIFQYDIDFVLDIQPGDRFTVVYEEVFQDGVPLRTGNILAAKFVNEGREYRAVRYVDAQGHGRVLHAGRQEPAQGVHPRARAVLAHQLALQSVAPPSGAQPHPRAQWRRLRGAGGHAGARRRRRPRAVRRAAGRLRQRRRARARLGRGHRLRPPVAFRGASCTAASASSSARSSATSA